ncbi:MAG: DUF418 domain-containing protein [Burkholderiales bacterium]|nr:DUF418 domain-containing protein [Burkholderiales bacterium]
MESTSQTAPAEAMVPIAANQRIEALDVVRGFALIGIFLMNIEFFNRAMNGIGEGMPLGLTGFDWFASWFVSYFVQGKFWTIFSLLFGMGFAVMMVRAERAGREFTAVYLRRILALAVFGAAHYIFLWEGDILFSYAVAALALLILLYGKAKYIAIGIGVFVALGFIPGCDAFFGVAFGLAFVGLIAIFLRSEKRVKILGRAVPLFSLILLSIGTLLLIAATVFWLLPDGPKDPRVPLSVFGPMLLVIGWLSWKYHEPVEKRSIRMAVTIYIFMALSQTIGGAIQHLTPPEPDVPEAKVAADTKGATEAVPALVAAKAVVASEAKPEANPQPAADATAKEATKADTVATAKTETKVEEKKPEKTKAQKAAERKADRTKRLADRAAETKNEVRVLSKGTYWEGIDLRARRFLNKAAGDAGFASLLIGMFLMGIWFVRSGVMENTGAHLAFFRKLAWIGLPAGIGLGLLGSLIAVSHVAGDRYDGFQFARGLTTLGNLPACLGYVGLVVLMLHSSTIFAKIRILAPVGRMALTNYLTQSLICSIYFYGYAMGHWGMPRGQQMIFVAVVFGAQIILSTWWLSRFRYGPMEWLWRGFTYRQTPAFKIDSSKGGALRPAM